MYTFHLSYMLVTPLAIYVVFIVFMNIFNGVVSVLEICAGLCLTGSLYVDMATEGVVASDVLVVVDTEGRHGEVSLDFDEAVLVASETELVGEHDVYTLARVLGEVHVVLPIPLVHIVGEIVLGVLEVNHRA